MRAAVEAANASSGAGILLGSHQDLTLDHVHLVDNRAAAVNSQRVCDIGAVEFTPGVDDALIFFDLFESANVSAWQ